MKKELHQLGYGRGVDGTLNNQFRHSVKIRQRKRGTYIDMTSLILVRVATIYDGVLDVEGASKKGANGRKVQTVQVWMRADNCG